MENEPTEPYQYTIEQLKHHLERIEADLEGLDDAESMVHMRQDLLRHEKEDIEHQIEIMKGDYGTRTERD